jgi:hypothetical protein
VTIVIEVHPTPWRHEFERGRTVRVGRAADNDIVVGRQLLGGRSPVSKHHAQIAWDGTRWSTLNVSDKPGLLRVYEPGYEEVPLEPGRPWVPVGHRWCLTFGHHDHPFHVLLRTDDHRGPAVVAIRIDLPTIEEPDEVGADDEPTAALDPVPAVTLTRLELDALLAYYSGFVLLPRPAVLEPRSHDEAARRLARSKDSTRKAIERANTKISAVPGAPAIATGRNISSEIGRWLARTGLLELDLEPTTSVRPAATPHGGRGDALTR